MERTRKQKWLIGCLSTAGVLVVLGGLAVGGFLMFMKSLHTVPPKSTQIVLQNDTSERLRIDRILYGSEDVLHADSDVVLDVKIPGKFTWYRKDMIRDQPEMTRRISIWYTGLTTEQQWIFEGIVRRVSGRPCGFTIYLRPGAGEISSCGYNELQDFEGD